MLPVPMPEVVTSTARFNGLPASGYIDEPPTARSPIGRLYVLACDYEEWAAAQPALAMSDRMADASAFAAAALACANQDAPAAVTAVAACQAILDLRRHASASQAPAPVLLARRAPRHGARSRF